MSEAELRARIAELEAELSAYREADRIPYRAVVEDMSELIVRWKPDGTRLFVNDAYCRLFGAERAELLGTPFWPLIIDEDRANVRARLGALSPESPVTIGRHRSIGAHGIVWTEWVDRAIFDAHGTLFELQSVGRDITERVKLEEQAYRVARGDAAARASAAIAHDLKNMLLVISGLMSAMAKDASFASHLSTVAEAVAAANGLLTQLSNVSHGVIVEPQPLDLGERISLLRPLLREITPQTIRLEEHLDPRPCRIIGDPTQIDQVLLNLVRNAGEAMPNGGVLRIETSLVDSRALLRVVDDGPGISQAILPRLFDAGITTKPHGQGLGLATVKAIVESHQGTIRVDSGETGTSFELSFPRAA
jgi:two-component system cell cycle sensor histidine kinase/response regulator CckA